MYGSSRSYYEPPFKACYVLVALFEGVILRRDISTGATRGPTATLYAHSIALLPPPIDEWQADVW